MSDPEGKAYAAFKLVSELFADGHHYVSTNTIRAHFNSRGLSYEPATVNRYLHEWKNEGRIFNAGRGWYSDLKDVFEIDPEPTRELIAWMRENFPLLDFTLWSTRQVAAHGQHLLANHLMFLNVERDSIAPVADALADSGRPVHANPLGTAAKNFAPKPDGIVVRPAIGEDLEREPGQLPIELVLVDLAIECERLNLFDSSECQAVFESIVNKRRIELAPLIHRSKYRKTDIFGCLEKLCDSSAKG